MTQQIAWPPSGGIHIHLNLATPTMAPTMPVPAPAQADDAPLQRMHDRLLAQIVRINDWCAEHAPDEYHYDGNTADAIIAAADRLRGQVARLELMLAAADAAAYAAAEASTTSRHNLATAIEERDEADGLLAKLADWLADKPVVGDGDVVMSAITLMESQAAEIKRLNADLALLRSYAIATPHGNGKSAAALDRLPPTDLPEQFPPAIVAAVEAAQAATVQPVEAALGVGDDPELADYIIGLDAGRHTWRTIPKPVRWRLVCSVLRSIWTDGKLPTMDDFDKHAPAWMPTANACATTFGDGKWTVMCGKAIEP